MAESAHRGALRYCPGGTSAAVGCTSNCATGLPLRAATGQGSHAVPPRSPIPPAGQTEPPLAAQGTAEALGSSRCSEHPGEGAAPPRSVEPHGGRRRRPKRSSARAGSGSRGSSSRLSAGTFPATFPAVTPAALPTQAAPFAAPSQNTREKPNKSPLRPFPPGLSLPTCPLPDDPAPTAPRRPLPAPPRWR
ncbi:uncharacterized protein LOC115598017 [Calypte anna]|uniref:uncharacterized protein LOC115598017 n=1 Tax=Calypte anna TaxID=9244 RepID=UPI0011C44824|nr:uncharacterized protein LOC115598017 [Calypte anna]